MTEKPKVIICGIVFRWEEKEPYVRSGKSVQGAQEYDSEMDALKCHECGEWFSTFFQPIRVGQGKQISKIDQVVSWAKIARGGRQQLFPIMHERPSCESKYGLCE